MLLKLVKGGSKGFYNKSKLDVMDGYMCTKNGNNHGRLVYVFRSKKKDRWFRWSFFSLIKNVYYHQLPPELCWCWNQK
jgi:hypothetical protein